MKLAKNFNSFKEGLQELMQVSFSAEQALKMQGPDPLKAENPEMQAVANLAQNAADDRPTGNGVDWGKCKIIIDAFGVDYKTTGGLRFGWSVSSRDFQRIREIDGDGGNCWTFYIQHPSGKFAEGSTLLQAGKDAGWELEK